MFIITKWQSKTALIATLFLFVLHAPLEAFSATEQLGKIKDFVLKNPRESLIGAGVVCLAVGLYAALEADRARVRDERYQEERRIAQEQFFAEQAAEQARIDALDLEQFVAECINPSVDALEDLLTKNQSAQIIKVHTDLLEKPLTKDERKALKKQLKFLCFKHGREFRSHSWQRENWFKQAKSMMERRIELDSLAASAFAHYMRHIEVLEKEMHTLDAIFEYQVRKAAEKAARNAPSEPRVVMYPYPQPSNNNYYYGKSHNNNGCQSSACGTPQVQTTASKPETPAAETEPAAPVVERELYDFNNPYHTLIGD